ncbi:MAG: HDOD domain-containing protein [Deltaproteobacteria bacterium]|nr:HDOD domain-containing protein [Deltaproteobacteria bacterium]
MDKQTFLQKLNQIHEISTLPIILSKVNRMLQDYETSIRKLSEVIESDQAITSKILKLVNSAFYGFRSKISNIPHALVILGFNSIRNAVISVSVFDTFSAKTMKESEAKDFWKHSVGVAVISKYLAGKTRLAIPEDSFVAGLLHDIGKSVMAQHFPEPFGQILASMREKGQTFYQAEKNQLPLNHPQIGGYISKRWQFPPTLIEAIEYHHAINSGATDLHLPIIVHIADRIANQQLTAGEVESELEGIAPEILKNLCLQMEKLEEWFPPLSAEIESACRFFLHKE